MAVQQSPEGKVFLQGKVGLESSKVQSQKQKYIYFINIICEVMNGSKKKKKKHFVQ